MEKLHNLLAELNTVVHGPNPRMEVVLKMFLEVEAWLQPLRDANSRVRTTITRYNLRVPQVGFEENRCLCIILPRAIGPLEVVGTPGTDGKDLWVRFTCGFFSAMATHYDPKAGTWTATYDPFDADYLKDWIYYQLKNATE